MSGSGLPALLFYLVLSIHLAGAQPLEAPTPNPRPLPPPAADSSNARQSSTAERNTGSQETDALLERWRLSDRRDRITRGRIVVAELEEPVGEVHIAGNLHRDVSIGLHFRCKEGRPTFFIYLIRIPFVSTFGNTVTYRIDNDQPITSNAWQQSDDRSSLGFFNHPSALVVSRRLARASELHIRISNRLVRSVEASFNLSGIERALRDVRAACNW